jgi:hypothetical protein
MPRPYSGRLTCRKSSPCSSRWGQDREGKCRCHGRRGIQRQGRLQRGCQLFFLVSGVKNRKERKQIRH